MLVPNHFLRASQTSGIRHATLAALCVCGFFIVAADRLLAQPFAADAPQDSAPRDTLAADSALTRLIRQAVVEYAPEVNADSVSEGTLFVVISETGTLLAGAFGDLETLERIKDRVPRFNRRVASMEIHTFRAGVVSKRALEVAVVRFKLTGSAPLE